MYYQIKLDQEAFLRQLTKDFKIDIVIITAGDKGCYIFHAGTFSFIKGYAVQVKDTIGAGDAFSAAFVYHYLKYHDVLKADDIANKLGSFVAGSRGAIPTYSPAIEKMLELE
jgi:fructokinase